MRLFRTSIFHHSVALVHILKVLSLMSDDFERAVVCLFDESASQQTKLSAQQYCTQIQQRNDVWKLCMERLCRFDTRPEVKFWCLQTLTTFFQHRSSLLQANDLNLIKQGMMSWITEIGVKQDVPVFIKGKFAQTLVILFKLLYPMAWPTFFKELFATLNAGEKAVELYVRILDAIDHEVVSRLIDRSKDEHQRNTLIKDAMREDCIPDMVKTWYTIIEARHPVLSVECLKIMPSYIDWIDINLITNENFMKLLFSLITVDTFQNEVCDCLYEICIKGMPAAEKLALLSKLQLPLLVNSLQYNSEEDDQFAARVAKLTSAIATQLVECSTALQQEGRETEQSTLANNLLLSILPLCFKLFGDQDDEVSSNMVTFMSAYLMQLKSKQKNLQLTEEHQRQINQQIIEMLQTIRKKAQYRYDFNFDPLKQDEYEAGFLEYRRELMILFKNTVRWAPELTKAFTKSSLLHALSPDNLQGLKNPNAPFADLEIALTLFYQIGEIFTEEISTPSNPNQEGSTYFEQLLAAIIEANVSSHYHESVKLIYFDIVARYSKLMIKIPQFIVPVLGSFVDERGMRSTNQIIKSRTTFIFLKIVKSLQNHLHPFVEDLYKYLKEFLTIDISQIEALTVSKSPSKTQQQQQQQQHIDVDKRMDDKLFLYEAMGNILSSDKVASNVRNQVLEQILQPILSQMDHILTNKLYLRDTDEIPLFATVLSHQISAIAYLSKGFGRAGNHLVEARQIFKRILVHNIVNVSKAVPNNQLVAEKVILYLHRMIALLGDDDVLELFPVIVSQLFNSVQNNEHVQLRDIVILINQLITKYGKKCAPLVNDLLMPLVGKLFQMINQGNYDQQAPSEETRQKMELHKTYFFLINTIICNNIGHVLTSTQNINQLNQILETIVQGCNHYSLHVSRLCFGTLKEIVKRYASTQPTEFSQLPNFKQYVHERIVSTCFSVPLQQSFDLHDGVSNQVLLEIVQILRELAKASNNAEFFQFLSQNLLPQLKLSSQDIQLLIGHLQTADEKTMKKVIKDLFKNLQQQEQHQQQR